MDSQENGHLRKTKDGFTVKCPRVPKMLWMKNRLQKNKSSRSSDLMDRVQAFMKQIAESNCQWEKEAATNPDAFNIEKTDDCEENVIEMDLAVVPVDGDSDTEESSNDEEYDDTGSSIVSSKLRTERKKRTSQLVQVLSGDNQKELDDDREESNDVILCDHTKPEDDQGESSDSSNSDSFVISGSKVKATQKRGPLVEVISSYTDEREFDDTVDTEKDEKQESDDSSDHYSDVTVDKFLSLQKKKRSGPLIELLNPEDAAH